MADQLRLALFLTILLLIWPVAEGTDRLLREVPASEILAKIEKGQPVEYDHVIVTGNLNLSNLKDLPSRHVDRTNGEIKYYGASEDVKIVRSSIRINDSVIDDIVSFNNTILENAADFTGTTFNRSAYFIGSNFDSYAYFDNSYFNSSAYFIGSTFNRSAYFIGSIFNRSADFMYSAFNSSANFRDSGFNRSAYFTYSAFNSSAEFIGATFNRSAHFEDTTFNGVAYFEDTKFNSYAYIIGTTFNSYAYFFDSTFNSYAYIRGSAFNSSDFSRAKFNKVASFENTQFNGFTSFNSSKFEDDALFEDAIFKDKLSLIRTKYDKLFIRWHNIMKGLVYDDAAYLSLLKNFKDLGYLEDYDCCYFEYRKEHRSQDWPGINDWDEAIRKAIDYPLEWFYGYGTRPLNAFFISLGIVVIFGVFWRTIGLGGTEDMTKATLQPDQEWVDDDITDILGFSVTVFLSGTKFFIDPPAVPKINGQSRSLIKKAFTLERLLGALFSILFFIAIGGTIVRSA